MGFHHVALATRDTAATHRFYTEVMGFELVKVVAGPTPGDHGGWSKHFFYATGPTNGDDASGDQGMIAFWELHDSTIGDDYPVDINTTAGLPGWVNHLAYDAPSRSELERHLQRWLDHGETVVEVDHGFCVSIYTSDPSNNMVEFCWSKRPFSDEEKARAAAIILDPNPTLDDEPPTITFHHPKVKADA